LIITKIYVVIVTKLMSSEVKGGGRNVALRVVPIRSLWNTRKKVKCSASPPQKNKSEFIESKRKNREIGDGKRKVGKAVIGPIC
jgi:hypothetical protein